MTSNAEAEMTGQFLDKYDEEILAMRHADRVREFWDKRALEEGNKVSAITNDPHLDEISTQAVLDTIKGLNPSSLLDVGCGNGGLMRAISGLEPKIHDIYGLDYSPEMVNVCHRSGLKTICCDISDTSLPFAPGKFDMIIGRRVLINMKPPLRRTALRNIAAMLRQGGKYIMVENFASGLENTNRLREKFSLPAIKQHWHNDYLLFSDLVTAAEFGLVKISTIHFGDFYYLASRIFGALMGESYHSPISIISAKISPSVLLKEDYCPESIVIFTKM